LERFTFRSISAPLSGDAIQFPGNERPPVAPHLDQPETPLASTSTPVAQAPAVPSRYSYRTSDRATPAETVPLLAHRIDKDTSGILLVGKNELTQAHLAKQFFEHSIERKYLALVWGDFAEDNGRIEGHIGRSLKNRKVMSVFPGGEYGKAAVTHYRVVERFGYVTLVECRLETGRTHQIRAHMQHIGHPLFNDVTYGGDKILKGTTFTKYKQFVQNCFKLIPRQALHAKSLGFVHPATGEKMFFDSRLPDDMAAVIEKWRNYGATKNSEQQ